MEIPEYFTVSPSNQIGDVYGTDFVFTANIPAQYNQIVWDLGDGTYVYDSLSATRAYQYPGLYKVSLSAWNNFGSSIEDVADVNVDYVYRDLVLFKEIPTEYGIPGIKSTTPFTVTLTSAKINEPICLVLQSFNTKSVPNYAVPDKWSFITPRWRFIDAKTNEIVNENITISAIPLYKDSKVVAVSGETSFYYIDDLSTGTNLNNSCPLLLAATLSTENFSYPLESLNYPYYSYSNSEVARAVIAWQVNDVIPTRLVVTENYINDIYPQKWSGIPIPIMITCEFDPLVLDELQNAQLSATKVLAYPRTNSLGAVAPVVLSLSGSQYYPPSAYKIDEPILFFKATDEQNNNTSGYIFTTITPFVPTVSSTSLGTSYDYSLVVTASTIATNQEAGTPSFSFPDGYAVYPYVYISHPFESSINRLNIVTYPSNCENINYYKNLGLLVEGQVSYVNVPTLTSTDLVNYTLSGTAAVYGMAFNPANNKLYAADSDQDTLYIYEQGKVLSKTVYLSSITNDNYNSPAYISTDSNSNVWVALYNKQRLLKFDPNLNFLLSVTPSVTIPLATTNNNEFGGIGEYLVAPPVAETDKQNNVWACFAHPLSSSLFKFNSLGTELFRVSSLPVSSVPVAISVAVDNSVWVACYNSNTIEHYSENGNLLQRISNIIHPSYLAIDRQNNVWYTYGYDRCGIYNTTTQQISSWKFDGLLKTVTPSSSALSGIDLFKATHENEIWGGLAVDVFNRVWTIDSENNTVFAFNVNEPQVARTFVVIPKADTNYLLRSNENFVTNVPVDFVRSAQAAGDWTGNRWYQKYTGKFNSLEITGVSKPFKVYDLENSFQIAKVNEEFDMASYFKSLALPEVLSENTKLFDKFLVAVVGDGNPTKESIGRIIYERTANFIQTHGDFETAEIEQLLSFARELSIVGRNYGTDFPSDIKRLLNLFSTPKHLLRGLPSYDSDDANNIGVYLSNTATITAGQYIFLKDKQFEKYQLVFVNPLEVSGTTQDVYPLSSLEVPGLREPLLDNYHCFEYEQKQIGYFNNIINWNSDYTTISYNLSTEEEWYGENGLVETMFNNILTKKLFTPAIQPQYTPLPSPTPSDTGPTPTPSPTNSPTPTSTLTPTPSPSNSPTPTPSNSPTPSATVTPTPTQTQPPPIGVLWGTTTPVAGISDWTRLNFAEDKFYAFRGAQTNTGAYSFDGSVWAPVIMNDSTFWKGVAWGNGVYVATGLSRLSISTNGTTWTNKAFTGSSLVNGPVIFGNNTFFTVSDSSNQVAYSTDYGTTWVSTANAVLPNTGIRHIAYGNGIGVLVTRGNPNAYISSNLISWTQINNPFQGQTQFTGIAYGNGRYVVVSDNSTNCFCSFDSGFNWSPQSINPFISDWKSVVFTGTHFVVISNSGGVAYSTDGIIWQMANILLPGNWQSMVFGNSRIVAAELGDEQVSISPPPGPTPTPSPSPTESGTPTPTPSPTESGTPTPTPSPSPTESGTPTPTPSQSNTPTPSPSPTESGTPTPTPSPSPTESGTPTPTPSPSPSPEFTPFPTPTPSPSPTESGTPTPTPSPSPTESGTPTPTPSPSPSPTQSSTPTPTPSPSPSPTQSSTPTPTPTSESGLITFAGEFLNEFDGTRMKYLGSP